MGLGIVIVAAQDGARLDVQHRQRALGAEGGNHFVLAVTAKVVGEPQ